MQTKALLLIVATVLCLVLAITIGDSSIRNLQAANNYNLNTGSVGCDGPDLSIQSAIPPCHGPTIAWVDLVAFIVFVAASVNLILVDIYLLPKYPLVKKKPTE